MVQPAATIKRARLIRRQRRPLERRGSRCVFTCLHFHTQNTLTIAFRASWLQSPHAAWPHCLPPAQVFWSRHGAKSRTWKFRVISHRNRCLGNAETQYRAIHRNWIGFTHTSLAALFLVFPGCFTGAVHPTMLEHPPSLFRLLIVN